MIEIDWGNLTPTSSERARVQERVDALAHLEGPTVTLRRRARHYEAHLKSPCSRPAELRVVGEDLASVVERAVSLLAT